MDKTILVLPGDGIGPEIAPVAVEVLQAAGLKAEFVWDDIGGAAFDRFGTPLVDDTLAKARMADAVLLGAVGGPKWEGVARENRPEAGLLRLRKELNLFANLRPAQCRSALVNASSLKPDLVSGLDILIVRELTGGVYFGEPRGVQTLASGVRQAIDTQVYSETEIERILEVAFDLAEKRSGRVCSVEKANVMETGAFWRDIAQSVGKKRKNIDLSHMYADNCAMQLVRAPKQFDVIVTDNLFGDLLSDCAAMLTGSLGMLPSASLGAPNEVGRRPGVFEPVHGSAPDIAGTGKANPCAMILSAAMACRYALDAPEIADRIEAAVDQALDAGHRTADLAVDGEALNCRAMGNAIIAMLDA